MFGSCFHLAAELIIHTPEPSVPPPFRENRFFPLLSYPTNWHLLSRIPFGQERFLTSFSFIQNHLPSRVSNSWYIKYFFKKTFDLLWRNCWPRCSFSTVVQAHSDKRLGAKHHKLLDFSAAFPRKLFVSKGTGEAGAAFPRGRTGPPCPLAKLDSRQSEVDRNAPLKIRIA